MIDLVSSILSIFTCGAVFGWLSRMAYKKLEARIPITQAYRNRRRAEKLNKAQREILKETVGMGADQAKEAEEKNREERQNTQKDDDEDVPWNPAWGGKFNDIDMEDTLEDIKERHDASTS